MSGMLFPKPEKQPKKPYKGLQTKKPLQSKSRLQTKTKLKGKPYKVSNDPVKEGDRCEIKLKRCTGTAVETHELKAGASFRSNCVKYGFKAKTCRNCHEDWELRLKDSQRLPLRQKKQLEVMEKHNWTKKDFIRVIGQNYL